MFSTAVPSPADSVDFVKILRGSGASRSTSAGSSNGRHTDSKLSSPGEQRLYATNVPGLPDYEYPAPWSLPQPPKQQDAPHLPEIDYPTPFTIKNTFIGANVGRPSSLEDFFLDRLTQSCPASGISLPTSGISLPPGLEDLVEPEEAAARFVAIEAERRREAEALGTFHSAATFGQPRSQFEVFPDTPFQSGAPEFLPPAPQPGLQMPWEFNQYAAPGHPAPTLVQAPPLPILLDSLLASQSKQTPHFNVQLSELCQPPAPPTQIPQLNEALPVPEAGSPECPTIGSRGHFYGECKPCAFLYTRGCTNGASCSFCHLCEPGEKKRRAKEKRTAKHFAMRQGF